MRILDLWCGTKSATLPFEDRGCEIVTVDNDPKRNPTICDDILNVTVDQLRSFGPFDFGWASPDCSVYSIANLHSRHFENAVPITEAALEQNKRVRHTLYLLENLCPLFVVENPRAMLRKQLFMNAYPRVTITYCQYGDDRMKPTDLWGRFPRGWTPRPMCKNGDSCHVASPRGSMKGTQGQTLDLKMQVPYQLGKSLFEGILVTSEAWLTLGDFT